jgi:hypothetical protein
MINRSRLSAAALAAIVAGGAVSASADVILTLTYDDLAGSFAYVANRTGTFSAVAVNTAQLQSAGQVSRLVPGLGNASFEAGFATNPLSAADFGLTISVAPAVNPNQALGNGTFTATDNDGDTITGTISGTWVYGGPGFIFFNGSLTNVMLNDLGAADGTFDGSESGDFDMDFSPAVSPFEGAIVQLVFGGANFFTSGFADRATNINMQVVPTPGSVALMGLAGLTLVGRRRAR